MDSANLRTEPGISMPRGQASVTFKKAPKVKAEGPDQLPLDD
jgi:hypothetical protein